MSSGDQHVYLEKYARWMNCPNLDREIHDELKGIADSHDEIKERFYQNIQFGTGGFRGIIGAGTDRMNVYTVRKATQGLAQAIHRLSADGVGNENSTDRVNIANRETNQQEKSVVIAYDCRHKSRYFAEQAAMVLAANGIRA